MTAPWEFWEIDIFDRYKEDQHFLLHHRAHITRQKQKRLRICFSILCNYYNFSFNKNRREQCSQNRKQLFLNPKSGLKCQKYCSQYGDLICVWESSHDRPSCPRCHAANFYPQRYQPLKCTHEGVEWIL